MLNLFDRSFIEVGGGGGGEEGSENFLLACNLYTNFVLTEFSRINFPFASNPH